MSIWRLKKIQIQNLLGFQDLKEWNFETGLQVLEAPNHNGKTSLTLAVLWGLTGTIPSLPRINRQSFRLTNKHAGAESEQFCLIEFAGDDGRRLQVKRLYKSGRHDLDKDLTVELDDKIFTVQQAQQCIFDELKMKPGSLEGCGVVLQDYRLRFITGGEGDISEVINDMLGLTVLSQLVPTLEDRLRDARDLKKEITSLLETADPFARWEQRDQEIRAEFQKRENEAISGGYTRDDLDDAESTGRKELAVAAGILEAAGLETSRPLEESIQALRIHLAGLRRTSKLGQELAEIQARRSRTDQWAAAVASILKSYTAFSGQLISESGNGEMDAAKLASAVADAESALQKNKLQREQVEDEKGLLAKAYHYLLGHQELRKCPVCDNDTSAADLTKRLKTRIEDQVADTLAKLKQQDKALTEQKAEAEKRLKAVKDLKDQHRRLCEQISAFQGQAGSEVFPSDIKIDADTLFLGPAERSALVSSLDGVAAKLRVLQDEISQKARQKQNEAEQQETVRFQPAELKITRVSEKLLPVIAAAAAVEAHGKLRDTALDCKTKLGELQDEAQTMAGQLQKISQALAQHEEQAASAAVQARLPGISGFFKTVAGNPDYDGLDIQTSISRDKVAYKIRAVSSTIGNLNDSVGHVLSEGDLSAASMALLLGLASGDSHHLGFLLLDDPAQGMDEKLQANLAKAMAGIGRPAQVVILTHQHSFADALKQAGAKYSMMHSWRSGRVQDV